MRPSRPALADRTTSMRFCPPSRHRPEVSCPRGPSPLSAIRAVSHGLDGCHLPRLAACSCPLPRSGFALQGFSLARSRTGFRPPLPSCRSLRPPFRQGAYRIQGCDSGFRALLHAPIHGLPGSFSDRLVPLLGFSLPRVLLRAPQGPLPALSTHGLPRPTAYRLRAAWRSRLRSPPPFEVFGLPPSCSQD